MLSIREIFRREMRAIDSDMITLVRGKGLLNDCYKA